jgi:hypothetical protein
MKLFGLFQQTWFLVTLETFVDYWMQNSGVYYKRSVLEKNVWDYLSVEAASIN